MPRTRAAVRRRHQYRMENESLEQLYAAAKRTMGAESWEEFRRHPSADSGWPGFTYTKDTVAFFERHRYAIFVMLDDDAQSQGITVPALIASFGIADGMTDYDSFANGLAWYAIEALVARENN